jgi:RNA polymerase sigma-70 factor (ECF subfamily)
MRPPASSGSFWTRVLETLPSDYRQVIMLRNIEEMSHQEVALRLNRSVGAVRMLWVRALKALRDGMQDNLMSDA